MKITLESTDQVAPFRGVECRMWQGHTESGIPVLALIPRVAVRSNERQEEFQRELTEQTHATSAISIRMIL